MADDKTMTRTPGLRGLRCLVVDDQEINCVLLRELLRLEGAEAICCRSGSAAVDAVRALPQAFDVVLMDLQMPGMDGYAATRGIRAIVGPGQLPIFALTADGPATASERVRAAGMQGVLHKPLDVARLVSVLAALPSGQ